MDVWGLCGMSEDLIRQVKKGHAFWPGNDAESRTGFYNNSSENLLAELTKSWEFSLWL